jgi:hypothetical protein
MIFQQKNFGLDPDPNPGRHQNGKWDPDWHQNETSDHHKTPNHWFIEDRINLIIY